MRLYRNCVQRSPGLAYAVYGSPDPFHQSRARDRLSVAVRMSALIALATRSTTVSRVAENIEVGIPI